MDNFRTVISICGGSGCGKSSLALRLVQVIGPERSCRIPTDFYLRSNPYPSLAEFFQHPLSYDWDLLEQNLHAGDGALVSNPVYDFVNFQRIAEDGCRPVVLHPIIILDAMRPYPKADLTILVNCPEEERKRRIIERDIRWKTRVIDFWELHQVTLADIVSESPQFDLALDGTASLNNNVTKVLSLLRFL